MSTSENARRLFKRSSEWQRDQHISNIQPSPGHFYADEMPTEERMASEWNHVFGASHATIDPNQLGEEFTRFVKIPATSRLQPGDVEALLAPISESETVAAIAQLPRFKAGGTTGLNHDFFKDIAAELTPSLTNLFMIFSTGAECRSPFSKPQSFHSEKKVTRLMRWTTGLLLYSTPPTRCSE